MRSLITNGVKILKGIALVVAMMTAAWLAYLHARHRVAYGHFAPLALHADTVVHGASIGIPGISKMYEGKLTNYGFLPVVVENCSYISDTNRPGAMLAYNIEQWDSAAHTWTQTAEFAKPDFCTPFPTSMGNTHWVRSALWPGQSISTGPEASGARSEMGATLRFVLVTEVTRSPLDSAFYPTEPFTLDEQKVDGLTPLRDRH